MSGPPHSRYYCPKCGQVFNAYRTGYGKERKMPTHSIYDGREEHSIPIGSTYFSGSEWCDGSHRTAKDKAP